MSITIIQGDALAHLENMDDALYDSIITDPPYCSGGEGARGYLMPTSRKYTNIGVKSQTANFDDSLTPRIWRQFTQEWLRQGARVTKPGGILAVFTDWRQYADLHDMMGLAGWLPRGVVVWDKVNARPQIGRFKQDAEFILWASMGKLGRERDSGFPSRVCRGVLPHVVPKTFNRFHMTEKPLNLMRDVVRITAPGGLILDPFAGSGTTLCAAKLEGYNALGIEIVPGYVDIARQRIQDTKEEKGA